MTASTTQMEEFAPTDETPPSQEQIVLTEQKSGGRRNPPARNTSRFWFERFLAVIQRQNPQTIDAAFLSQIAPSNEGKLLAQLKFLGVIDEQGKPTRILPMLNMVGEEQKKAFSEIANQSYSDLLGEVKVEKAVPDDLINFFIRKYSFTRDKAVNASKFFLYLAEKASLQVSQELGSFLAEKTSNQPTVSNGAQLASARSPERTPRMSVRENKAVYSPAKIVPGRSSKNVLELEALQPKIQATINITLDKDTPKEYWDRVLALLGEEKDASEDSGASESVPIPMEQPENQEN